MPLREAVGGHHAAKLTKEKTDFRRDNLFSFQRVSSLNVIYKTTMQQVTIELIFNKRRMDSDLPMD